MRDRLIPTEQQLANKINAKIDFTYPTFTKRYIVGVKELHKSKNPSIYYDDIYKDTKAAVSHGGGTFGGWLDKETGEYCVDAGIDVDDLDVALDWGRACHQKAIYDSKEDKVIFIESLTDES